MIMVCHHAAVVQHYREVTVMEIFILGVVLITAMLTEDRPHPAHAERGRHDC
jgi:hypothetical protein